MPSARSSMLDRAPHRTIAQPDEQPAGRISRRRLCAKRRGAPPAGWRSRWSSRFGNWPAAPAGSIRCSCRRPSAIAVAIYKLAMSVARSGSTFRLRSFRIGSGWVLGTVAGVIIGFAIGLSTLARGVGITFISALFPIPKIALLPLLILWLGIGEEPKIATIALGVFFSTAISVYSGVDAVPRNLIRMAQSFNVPFHAIVRQRDLAGRAAIDPGGLSHHGVGGAAAGGERGNDRRPVRHRRVRAAGR